MSFIFLDLELKGFYRLLSFIYIIFKRFIFLCIYLYICLFNLYFLKFCCVLSIFLGIWDMGMNKIDKNLSFYMVYIILRRDR